MNRTARNRLGKHIESLENRQVLSASAPTLAMPASASAAATPPPEFDTALDAHVQKNSNGKSTFIVDGSDFRDGITVQSFSNSNLTLKLDRLGSSGEVLFSRTVTLKATNLDTANPLQIHGKDQNDRIVNLTSLKAMIWGGDGNDEIKSGSAGDTAYGGNGDDTFIGAGGKDTFNGEAGKDYLRGGGGADTLYGGSGEDLLYGELGNDIINGGSENDFIWGGLDQDTLNGDGGHDTIYGDNGAFGTQGGKDIIFGGVGDDFLFGEGGDDLLHGDFGLGDNGGGNDTLYGGFGNDKLNGNDGNDKIYGEEGHDDLHGQNGVDNLDGGAGNDKLDGGFNDPDFFCDSLIGGIGADTFIRHKSTFSVDDADIFQDFNSSLGDKVENTWHW